MELCVLKVFCTHGCELHHDSLKHIIATSRCSLYFACQCLKAPVSLPPNLHSCMTQALCTEASLVALRRSYPQIYTSDDKLLVDPRRVSVRQQDFEDAFRSITPASGRSVASPARYESFIFQECSRRQRREREECVQSWRMETAGFHI
jgi:hypothetical protein